MSEFKDAVSQQREAQQLRDMQESKRPEQAHEHPQDGSEEPESPSQIDALSETEEIKETFNPQDERAGSDDEVGQIVDDSDTYKLALNKQSSVHSVQAEPSRCHLAVVANERKKEDTPRSLEQIQADNKDRDSWVIKDTCNMQNFHELIRDPALEFNFELDEF